MGGYDYPSPPRPLFNIVNFILQDFNKIILWQDTEQDSGFYIIMDHDMNHDER